MAINRPVADSSIDKQKVEEKAQELKNKCIQLRNNKTFYQGDSKEKELEYEKMRMQRRGMLWAIGELDSLQDTRTISDELERPKTSDIVPVIKGTDKWHIPRKGSEQSTIDQFLSGADKSEGFCWCGISTEGFVAMIDLDDNEGEVCQNCVRSYKAYNRK